jgi:hypothetical protein
MNRRKGAESPSTDGLRGLVSSCESVVEVVNQLRNSHQVEDGDSFLLEIDTLETEGWLFGLPIHRRALKCLCVSDFKWSRWVGFTTTTRSKIIQMLGEGEGSAFWQRMVNELIQKHLRGIPSPKASSRDEFWF